MPKNYTAKRPRSEAQTRQENLETALKLARSGLSVFPCKPNQRPYTQTGFKAATTDTQQIEIWWISMLKHWPIDCPSSAGFRLEYR